VRRGALPVSLARVNGLASGTEAGETPAGGAFTDRLVAKFGLPVAGWRGQGSGRVKAAGEAVPHAPDEEPRGHA
jgi:hypothetical protein